MKAQNEINDMEIRHQVQKHFKRLVHGSLEFITEIEGILNLAGLKKRNIYTSKTTKKPSYCIKYATGESKKLYDYMYNGVYISDIKKVAVSN